MGMVGFELLEKGGVGRKGSVVVAVIVAAAVAVVACAVVWGSRARLELRIRNGLGILRMIDSVQTLASHGPSQEIERVAVVADLLGCMLL